LAAKVGLLLQRRARSLNSGSLHSVLASPVSCAGRRRVLSSAFALSVSHRLVFSIFMKPFPVVPLVASRVTLQSAAEISGPKVYRRVLAVFLSSLTIVVALTLNLLNTAKAAEPSKTEATM